jgi:Fe2+ transport system protein B
MSDPVTDDSLFKIGRILQVQKKNEQALDKYIEVCNSVTDKIRANPDVAAEYHLIVLSITQAVELYKLRRDTDKALLLLNVERKMLELMEAHRDSILPQTDLLPILDEMTEAFSRVTDRQQIVDNFVQAKLIADAQKADANREKVLKAAEELRERHKRSTITRIIGWIENHPVLTLLISLVVMAIVLAVVFVYFEAIPRRKPYGHLRPQNLGRRGSPARSQGPFADSL